MTALPSGIVSTSLSVSRVFTAFIYTVLLLAFVLGGARTGSGQNSNSGEIRGTVTDPSGASVPGVAVTILNTETGGRRDLVTNDGGVYDAVSVLPGNYQITFDKGGFDKLVRSGISLTANPITIDARLHIGTSQQEVMVTEEAPLLQTESGEQSTTLDTKACSSCRTSARTGPILRVFCLARLGREQASRSTEICPFTPISWQTARM